MASRSNSRNNDGQRAASRSTSLSRAAENARISQDAPIILFMGKHIAEIFITYILGGPGGGKTRYAAKIREELEDKGLVHICMPDLIRQAIAKYKDKLPEWNEASEKYQRGELISNKLAQQLIKAEMGKYPYANVYFLEGFPREAEQVEDFEKNVRRVNMALILDYDEDTLRTHMLARGLLKDVVDRRITEFKLKTLPSAKYFDDQRLLHLIPGEKEDNVIFERMLKLIKRAMEAGIFDGFGSGRSSQAMKTPSDESAKSSVPNSSTKRQQQNQTTENQRSLNSSPLRMSENEMENEDIRLEDNTSARTPNATTTPEIINPVSPLAQTTNPTSPLADALTSTTIRDQTPRPQTQQLETSSPKNEGHETARKSLKSSGSGKSIEQLTNRSIKSVDVESVVSLKQNGLNNKENSTPRTPQHFSNSPSVLPTPPKPNINNSSDNFPKGLPTEGNAPHLGAPGSNKSIFAQRVAKKYEGFVYISMGELFRRKVLQNNEDELWIKIGKKIDAGEVIPMKICRELLYSTIHEMGNRSWGYVIEGYPRTLPQAEDIENQVFYLLN